MDIRSFGHMAGPASTNNESKLSSFMVTPYKLYLSVTIDCFLNNKSKWSQSQIGAFSRLIMKLIQSLDTSFAEVKSAVDSLEITKLSTDVNKKLDEIMSKDVEALMALMVGLKSYSTVHKSSFLGLFIRKMVLFFDKLSFTSASGLCQDFKKYLRQEKKQVTSEEPNIDTELQNRELWRKCPKQVDFFFAKQVKLMSVNEKLALDPAKLGKMITTASKDIDKVSGSDLMASNGLNFVRFLNNLRVQEYHGAIESLKMYFDLNGNSNNKCWSSFNTAMVYYHFGHFDLAVESIKECISASQEFNDDKCLEFVLLLFVKILIKKNTHYKSSIKSGLESDIVPLLIHLQTKSNSLNLPVISTISALHLEQIIGHPCKHFTDDHGANSTFFFPALPEVVCIKNSLNSVLMMVYGNKSGHFAKLGLSTLSFVTSQLLLHLYAVDIVGEELVHHVNESTCLGIRNVASELWYKFGMYQSAVDLLNHCSELFSVYNKDTNAIWKQSVAEINFERALLGNYFRDASNEIDTIKIFDANEAKLRSIELLMKKKSFNDAYDRALELEKLGGNFNEYFKLRLSLIKSEIIKNVTLTLKCIECARAGKFYGLQAKCFILLAQQLTDLGLSSQSLLILRKSFIFIISNGCCSDVAKASHLFAKCYQSLPNQEKAQNSSNYLNLALRYNLRAISKFEMINDVENILDCYKFHACVLNELGRNQERNLFSKKYRTLSTSLTCN